MTKYRKTFPNSTLLNEELEGYWFYSNYYRQLPNVTTISESSHYIDYEDISSDKNTTLFSLLRNSDTNIDMRSFFLDMSQIARTYGKYSHVIAGGTKKFYAQRIDRLRSNEIAKLYEKFQGQIGNQLTVNSHSFHMQTDVLNQIVGFTDSIDMTYVIPSQGDLHDMNIFQNGYIVDFEAAGWNRLSTDLATFIHHIIVGGNYFGPKYAKWAEAMKLPPINQVKNIGSNTVQLELSAARKSLIKDYMRYYIGELNPGTVSTLDREFSYMLALRLLTVFDVTKMTQEDLEIIFILMNYFVSEETLDKKLARLVA
jgi:hypothetical protein